MSDVKVDTRSRGMNRGLTCIIFTSITGICFVAYLIFLGVRIKSEQPLSITDALHSITIFILAITLVWSICHQRQKERFEQSEILLRSTLGLIDKAYDVLANPSGGPTADRIAWVTAARLLKRSVLLSEQISNEAHRKIFESERDFQRHQFGKLLRPGGKELPLEFFFGVGHICGDVGRSATSTVTVDDVKWIPLAVIEAIYSFKEFPDGYQDSLDSKSRLTRRQLEKAWVLGERGVYDYHVFRDHYIPVGNSVIAKKGPKKDQKMTEQEINHEISSFSGTAFGD